MLLVLLVWMLGYRCREAKRSMILLFETFFLWVGDMPGPIYRALEANRKDWSYMA